MTKFMMLRDIIALKDFSAQQKLVLIAMNQYGDDGHNIYPAIETSAGMVSMSPRNTARQIRKLRDKGYLVATGKSHRNTINYRMVIPHYTTVMRTMTPVSLPKEHPRHTTTLNNKPSNNPPRVLGSKGEYFDSDLGIARQYEDLGMELIRKEREREELAALEREREGKNSIDRFSDLGPLTAMKRTWEREG